MMGARETRKAAASARLAATTLLLALALAPFAARPAAAGLAGLDLVDAQGARLTETAPAGVTLVGLWATWCPSCRTELPELVALGHELSERGVRLVLVSVDRTPEKAARYLEGMAYAGDAAYDPGARSATKIGIEGIPTVLVLDASGKEQARIVGSGKKAMSQIRAEVAALQPIKTVRIQ
jgi:thiol-disulfide isomerase/thioredoxin